IFIAAILFGILLYWRESNGNKLYKLLNKIVNSQELQIKPDDKTGFIYQQKILLRIVYITFLFLIISLVFQFLTPFKPFGSYNGISLFASCIVGTLIGTYVATFVIKSGEVIEVKKDDLSEIVSETIEKGKDIIEDITSKEEEVIEEELKEEVPKKNEKSARERLKDKGFLK
ncbi:MAG: hypothetical protein KJN82_00115, partial [Bacteroidia bacterium]|nr:hypothetical protein [Bacteroidia bacterium]